ncbi:conserved hypothetical protein [Acaryochloris marina MBIC11017]|uniref:eCIS core domain-containing protein n=2 Tax=Acaryochloris marina TaxID=155978 RepID=B0C2R5_ACAM1|nr:conserved hypothetical protein [Acaryochloris marina MBIC11017]
MGLGLKAYDSVSDGGLLMKRTHAYKPEKSKSQPIPQQISSDQAQSATPVPPPIQAKTNEEGLAEWKAQQEKWEKFGTPWQDKVPNPSGELAQPWIQRKLTLGQPGDKYEQEADRIASQVVQQINAPTLSQFNQGQSVQREKELEEEVLAQSIRPAIQRQQEKTDEKISSELESSINTARGSGQPLDTGLQQSMGQVMGADFSGVRVHTDAQSDQLNQSIQARAFTTGQDVFFREGAYQPGNRHGQELIAHELTHVVQQNSAIQAKRSSVSFERLPSREQTEKSAMAFGQPSEIVNQSPAGRVHRCCGTSGPTELKDELVGTGSKPGVIVEAILNKSEEFASLKAKAGVTYKTAKKGTSGSYDPESHEVRLAKGQNTTTALNAIFETANAIQHSRFAKVKNAYDKGEFENGAKLSDWEVDSLDPLNPTTPEEWRAAIQEYYEWDSFQLARKTFEEVEPFFKEAGKSDEFEAFGKFFPCENFSDYIGVAKTNHYRDQVTRLNAAKDPKRIKLNF